MFIIPLIQAQASIITVFSEPKDSNCLSTMPTDPDQINANQDEEKQASASGKPAPKVQDMTGQLKSPLTENPPPNTIQLLLPLPASNTLWSTNPAIIILFSVTW